MRLIEPEITKKGGVGSQQTSKSKEEIRQLKEIAKREVQMSKKVEPKSAYLKKSGDYIFCCGIYK